MVLGWRSVGALLPLAAVLGCGSGQSTTSTSGELVGKVFVSEGVPATTGHVALAGTPFGAPVESDGRFYLSSIPVGAWKLEVFPGGAFSHYPPLAANATINPGQIRDVGDIVLLAPGFVAGQVFASAPVTADGTIVGIIDSGNVTTPTVSGAYLLGRAPPGVHDMVAVKGGGSVTRANVEVVPDAITSGIDFNLALAEHLPVGIEGTAAFVDGGSDGIRVSLLDAGDGTTVESVVLDSSGAFSFEVDANAYVVRAQKGDSLNQASIPSGVLSAGRTFTVRLLLSSGDADGDGIPDETDPDIDNDGTPNEDDAFPYDARENSDSDGDGIGDNSDPDNTLDSDQDGIVNPQDNCPAAANANQVDSDTDLVGDACDNCPHDANSDQIDGDGDGVGQACDSCDDVFNPGQEPGSCTLSAVRSLLAVGVAHTCAATSAGKLRCWGLGASGQLGYDDTQSIGDDEVAYSGGDVAVGGTVIDVAVADAYSGSGTLGHSCAVLAGGAVRCWGEGSSGRLGYGSTINVGDGIGPSIGVAGDVPVGGPVSQISAGSQHTCALLESGAVRCWGQGGNGRLGYGNQNNVGGGGTSITAAGDVPLGGTAVQVSAGYAHTCALMATGAVRCWGTGASGRLGYGSNVGVGHSPTTVPSTIGDVPLGGTARQISAGHAHTCAVMSSGAVRCWGSNSNGQLGYGHRDSLGGSPETTPSMNGDINLGATATYVAAGRNHTCAVLTGGAVRCWGAGHEGELGSIDFMNPVIGDDEAPLLQPLVNIGGAIASRVGAAGHELAQNGHTCALAAGDVVYCWGTNAYGAMGYGDGETVGDNETPAAKGQVPWLDP